MTTEDLFDMELEGEGITSGLEKIRLDSNTSHLSEYEIGREECFISQEIKVDDIQKKKMQPSDFKKKVVLGKGGYGKVYLVEKVDTNQLYAMKVLKKATLKVLVKGFDNVKAERQILSEVQHPFIVKLFYAFQTEDRLYLILDYVQGGELFFHLANERMFSEDIAKFYLAQLILALEHLHELGIIYRDLKPENCLLDKQGNIVLTDFGLSKVGLDDMKNGRTNTVCGTTEYMAPEILMEQSYDHSVDWWSLGIMLYDMLTGSPPFKGNNRKKVMDSIMKTKLKLPNYLTQDAKDLLGKLLKKNANARLGSKGGAKQIKAHPFFKKINWDRIYFKKDIPPIVPVLLNPLDISNFDQKFTNSPLESPENPSPIKNESDNFLGFSYVAPNGFTSLNSNFTLDTIDEKL
ncbi:Pkinase-domain-containing protein [Neoconidiobolus thromboides FSU 785]|nr:Pkinase-domain-containing protein [Neoconidiobolus thromboides FSU 785]